MRSPSQIIRPDPLMCNLVSVRSALVGVNLNWNSDLGLPPEPPDWRLILDGEWLTTEAWTQIIIIIFSVFYHPSLLHSVIYQRYFSEQWSVGPLMCNEYFANGCDLFDSNRFINFGNPTIFNRYEVAVGVTEKYLNVFNCSKEIKWK